MQSAARAPSPLGTVNRTIFGMLRSRTIRLGRVFVESVSSPAYSRYLDANAPGSAINELQKASALLYRRKIALAIFLGSCCGSAFSSIRGGADLVADRSPRAGRKCRPKDVPPDAAVGHRRASGLRHLRLVRLRLFAPRMLKCKACCRQFSVTSGTLLANWKLPFRTLLMAFGRSLSDKLFI